MYDHVLCLVSGGMDSVTALHMYVAKKCKVSAISFNYGSKHNRKELEFAQYHANALGIPHQIVEMEFLNELLDSHLLKSGGEIPDGHYTDAVMSKTVVPFRNGILLSLAAGHALSIDAQAVAIASHAGDHTIYPDCRPAFNLHMGRAIYVGTDAKVELVAPFKHMTKTDIAVLGKRLGVDYSKTWSCYKGGDEHCGVCGTCVERLEALAGAGIK